MRNLLVVAILILGGCAGDIPLEVRPETFARKLTADEAAIRELLYSECVAGRTDDTFYVVEGEQFVRDIRQRLKTTNLRGYRDAVFVGLDRRVVDLRTRQAGFFISVSDVNIADGAASARIQIVRDVKNQELRAADLKKDGEKWVVTQWYRTFT